MNSIQESTNELNAAIRYAENAIASANQTIESMQFRQDMAKKQYTEQTGREQALEDENERLKRDVEFYTKEYNDLAERLKMEIAALERIRGENYQLQDKLAEDIPNMPTIPKPMHPAARKARVDLESRDARRVRHMSNAQPTVHQRMAQHPQERNMPGPTHADSHVPKPSEGTASIRSTILASSSVKLAAKSLFLGSINLARS